MTAPKARKRIMKNGNPYPTTPYKRDSVPVTILRMLRLHGELAPSAIEVLFKDRLKQMRGKNVVGNLLVKLRRQELVETAMKKRCECCGRINQITAITFKGRELLERIGL